MYQIHGLEFSINPTECGLYEFSEPPHDVGYSSINIDNLIHSFNKQSIDKTIMILTRLRDIASKQASWESAPNPASSSILLNPSPVRPIEEVREYIQNTEKFCNYLLDALNIKCHTLHGIELIRDRSEFGLYHPVPPLNRLEYRTINIDDLVSSLNKKPIDEVVEVLTSQRDLAIEQANWEISPKNPPTIAPRQDRQIDEVRKYIKNTERFCTYALRMLQPNKHF